MCSYLNAEAGCQASELKTGADRACDVDADCVDVLGTPSCMDSCYGGAIVSKAGAKAIAAGLDAINASVCKDFDANECNFYASGCPYAGPREPACLDGQCGAVIGCALGTRQGQRVLDAVAPELAKGCTTDADCTTHVPYVCSWNCGSSPVFVSNANEAAYDKALQDAQAACDSGASGETCPIPPCTPTATPGAMCQAGTCVEQG